MSFAQINYQQKVGNSNLTIAEIGCFDTADCNLAEDFGHEIDPPTLNAFYTDNHIYTYDLTDRANDDITWTTITRRFPDIVVDQINNSPGWPQTNKAIVKFVYKGHSGALITHFCKVADPNAHLIVDSYDGKVKGAGPGTYYGEPVAHATYKSTSTPPPAQAAPSAPAAPSVAFTPLSEQVTVTADTLMVRSGPATSHPGGQANSTDGNIHKGTVVGITGWTHGERVVGNDIWLRSVQGHWFWSGGTNFNLGQLQAAPAAPASPPAATPQTSVPAETPAAPTKPANTTYTKLATPLDLVTNKQPTSWWELGFKDDAHATAAAHLNKGTGFRAYGKAQRTDGDKPCYYMIQEDFGNADTTGIPVNNNGVNTVDLSPAPAPVAPAQAVQPTPTAATTVDGGEKVDVKVNPTDPNAWKNSFHIFQSPQDYVASATVTCQELASDIAITQDHPAAQELLKGQTVKIGGTFEKDNIRYYRTQTSIDKGFWYGIPEVSVKKLVSAAAGDESGWDELIEDIKNDTEIVVSEGSKLAKAATASGLVNRVLRRNQK